MSEKNRTGFNWCPQWRYRFLFGLMILYMSVACVVACTLFWSVTVTYNKYPEQDVRNDLVLNCAVESDGNTLLNCSSLDGLEWDKFVANGWTKVVHRAYLEGNVVAVKSVNVNGKDISDCSKKELLLHCHNRAVDKLVREIELLKGLKHETIVGLIQYCFKVKGEVCIKNAIIATEIGEPLTNLRLLQMTWKERSQIIRDLALLLHYAQNSPLGVLALADLRRPQFVLVKGRMKLSDLDDIVIGEPACSSSADCSNLNISIQCIQGLCNGYNSKFNIQKSFREFGPYIFIPEGVPKEKKFVVEELRRIWKENNVTTQNLLLAANQLL